MKMTRRELFEGIGALTVATGIRSLPAAQAEVRLDHVAAPLNTLPGLKVATV